MPACREIVPIHMSRHYFATTHRRASRRRFDGILMALAASDAAVIDFI